MRPSWDGVLDQLGAADGYWLATTRPSGLPHLVPVLAVLVEGAMHFAAGPLTRKSRNLARSPRCVLSARCCSVDLVVEGVVARVEDGELLRRVAEEYLAKYAWPVSVVEGALMGEGAPTAGPPPYDVYRLEPRMGFAFPTDESQVAARWKF